MIIRFKAIKKFVIPGVVLAVTLSAVSCFDMYGDIWDSANMKTALIISSTSSCQVWLADSDGNFTNKSDMLPSILSMGAYIKSEVVDFDHDGDADFAVINSSGNVYVLKQKSGRFTVNNSFTAVSSPRDFTIADFNKDGNMELFSVDTSSIYINSLLTGTVFNTFGFSDALSVSSGDFNKDGYADVIIGIDGSLSGDNVVWFNTYKLTPWSFSQTSTTTATHRTDDSAVADFDNNGYKDIVEINNFPTQLYVFLNNDGANFSPVVPYTLTAEPVAVTAGDLNNDGFIDIFASQGSAGYTVLINKGDGTFIMYPYNTYCTKAILHDVDSDGDLDACIYYYNVSFYLSILKNDGEGVFTAGPSQLLPVSVNSMSLFVLK